MTTTRLAAVLVVIALIGAAAIIAGVAVLWGLGYALLTAGTLTLGSVVAVCLYDGDKT